MQDPENEQTTPDAGENETPDYSAEPVEIFPEAEQPSDEGQSTDETEPPKKESRVRRFFRKLFRWTLGILVIIGLGFLAAVFLIYQPKVAELNQAYANLENIQATLTAQDAQIADLENQVASLEQQLESLQGENATLLSTQSDCQLHTALLQARANVMDAQVALYAENPTQARTLLEDTGELLNSVETMLPKDTQGVIAPLQARLDLALSELETDPDTAIKDLSILAGDLLEIENTLFEGEGGGG
jgi:uncharacterized protein HemX